MGDDRDMEQHQGHVCLPAAQDNRAHRKNNNSSSALDEQVFKGLPLVSYSKLTNHTMMCMSRLLALQFF